jgi:hypothetical protein
MARDCDRDGIGRAGPRNRSRAATKSDRAGDFRIGSRLPARNRGQLLPDTSLKTTPAHVEGDVHLRRAIVDEGDDRIAPRRDGASFGPSIGAGKFAGQRLCEFEGIRPESHEANAHSRRRDE